MLENVYSMWDKLYVVFICNISNKALMKLFVFHKVFINNTGQFSKIMFKLVTWY